MDLKDARMPCPECKREAAPLEGSTFVVAWYRCDACGYFWSARIRNGQPLADTNIVNEAAAR